MRRERARALSFFLRRCARSSSSRTWTWEGGRRGCSDLSSGQIGGGQRGDRCTSSHESKRTISPTPLFPFFLPPFCCYHFSAQKSDHYVGKSVSGQRKTTTAEVSCELLVRCSLLVGLCPPGAPQIRKALAGGEEEEGGSLSRGEAE